MSNPWERKGKDWTVYLLSLYPHLFPVIVHFRGHCFFVLLSCVTRHPHHFVESESLCVWSVRPRPRSFLSDISKVPRGGWQKWSNGSQKTTWYATVIITTLPKLLFSNMYINPDSPFSANQATRLLSTWSWTEVSLLFSAPIMRTLD